MKAFGETLLKFNERYLLGATCIHFGYKGSTFLANKKINKEKLKKIPLKFVYLRKKQ